MPRETIGRYNNQEFFVGSDQPAPPPVTRYTTPVAAITDTPAPPPTTTPTPDVPAILTPEAFATGRAGSVDENAIREQTRKNMQAQIDATNAYYANLVSQQETKNEGFTGQTRAVNVRSGLMGSDFGNANMAGQEKANSAATKAIRDEQSMKIAEVNGKIDEIFRAEVKAKKDEALGNAEAYATYLDKAKTEGLGTLKAAAQTGAQLDPQRKAYLKKVLGYDDLTLESVYAANKPQPEYYSPMQLKDGSLVIVDKQGNMKNLGKYDLPQESTFVFAPDGTPFVFNKDTGQAQVASGFKEGQFAAPRAINNTNIYGGINEPDKILTVEEAKALNVPYGTTRGKAFGNIPTTPLTGEALNKQNALNTMEKQIASAEQLGEKSGYAGVGGMLQGTAKQFLAKNFGKGTAEEQDLRNLIGNIKATLAKERGGTSFTANEQRLLETYTPTIDDSSMVIKSKFNSLKQFIQNSRPSGQAPSGSTSTQPQQMNLNGNILNLQPDGTYQ